MTRTRKPPQQKQNDRKVWTCAAIALICVFCVQALLALSRLSATTDEPVHLSAGYSYWQTLDFRLNPEHPPLAKLVAALPLLVLKPNLDTSSIDWTEASEYPFGFAFLYGNDADRILFWGRVPMIVLAALGGWITFLFARDLFGPPAGAFAAGLYCFCPNLLAHGMLITTDVPLAAFTVLTLYLFWKRCKKPSWKSDFVTGLALGAAMASKFSGAVLPVLIVVFCLARKEIKSLLIMAAASLLVIESAYLFSASPLLYFQNVRTVNANHDPNYESYLLGQLKQNGWWYYFLVAFIFKATLPTLILISIAVIKTLAGFIDWRGETILLSAIVLYFVAVSAGADELGVRYLLPIFPLIYIWVSRIVPLFWNSRLGRAALCCLLIWQIGAAVGSYPHYITYFNELAGGSERGPDILDDSNVDWGQSLKEVAHYVKTKQITNVVLCPFSAFENPAYYGLTSTVRAPKELVFKTPTAATYIISAHNVAWMKAVDAAWRSYQPIDRIGGMWVYRF